MRDSRSAKASLNIFSIHAVPPRLQAACDTRISLQKGRRGILRVRVVPRNFNIAYLLSQSQASDVPFCTAFHCSITVSASSPPQTTAEAILFHKPFVFSTLRILLWLRLLNLLLKTHPTAPQQSAPPPQTQAPCRPCRA